MFNAEFFRLVLAIAWGVGIVAAAAYSTHAFVSWLGEDEGPDSARAAVALLFLLAMIFLAGSGYLIYRNVR